jgi:hypothetical protein
MLAFHPAAPKQISLAADKSICEPSRCRETRLTQRVWRPPKCLDCCSPPP